MEFSLKLLLEVLLLVFLVVCAIAVAFTKKTVNAVIIYSSFGTAVSVLWLFLEAPDLALTEAAVGAGISSALFFLVLKVFSKIDKENVNE